MDGKVFIAQGLTKTCAAGEIEIHALRGLDLEVQAGEVVVLPGPSGSGKSTLLNIMGGQISGVRQNPTRRAAAELAW